MGKGASCIFISTWNRGSRAAHAHSSPSRSPSPRRRLGKRPTGLQCGAKGPANADHPAFCGGALGKSCCFAPPIPTHTSTPKACVYIFSGNFPGQKSPLTLRLAHPYPFSWFYLPPQLSFLCEKLGFSRIDRKFLKRNRAVSFSRPLYVRMFSVANGNCHTKDRFAKVSSLQTSGGWFFFLKIGLPYVYINI